MSAKYKLTLCHGHHRANANGHVYEHILIAEKILGRAIEDGEVVHHINHDTRDNRMDNLQVFQSHAAHMQYHASQRAFSECGNAEFRKCCYCHKYDSPENLKRRREGNRSHWHPTCRNEYRRNLRAIKGKDRYV